jgi:hypothetical protein
MKDLHNRIKVVRSISPVTGAIDNTAQVGQIVDHQGYEAVEYLVATGTLADVDATFTALLEVGDQANLSDAVAVPTADRLGALPSFIFSDDDKVFKVGYVGPKRYSRLTITPAANTGAWGIGAVAVLSHARHQPVA